MGGASRPRRLNDLGLKADPLEGTALALLRLRPVAARQPRGQILLQKSFSGEVRKF